MKVEQFVLAYEVEQDRIRALLPRGYSSLRPVLRINTEIRNDKEVYVEFNVPVSHNGTNGWLNITNWSSERDPVSFRKDGKEVLIEAPFMELHYAGTGMRGGCPAEKDNGGCFFLTRTGADLMPPERIEELKEFCDASFAWHFSEGDACGKSQGKTLPAAWTPPGRDYPKTVFSAENAAAIPCQQVLGTYIVRFTREEEPPKDGITANLYYTGKGDNALRFAEEMISSGTVAKIRAEEGNLQYDYFHPLDDPETVLLIDSWDSQEALDAHLVSPMMTVIAELREKYDLTMRVERYKRADLPLSELPFIRIKVNGEEPKHGI